MSGHRVCRGAVGGAQRLEAVLHFGQPQMGHRQPEQSTLGVAALGDRFLERRDGAPEVALVEGSVACFVIVFRLAGGRELVEAGARLELEPTQKAAPVAETQIEVAGLTQIARGQLAPHCGR